MPIKRVLLRVALIAISLATSLFAQTRSVGVMDEPIQSMTTPISESRAEWWLTLSNELDISVEEAEARYSWTDLFAEALETTKEQYPETFAGGRVHRSGAPGATVSFVGVVPAEAKELFGHLPVPIVFTGDAEHSQAEILRAVPMAHYSVMNGLASLGYGDDQVTTQYDRARGVMVVRLLGESFEVLPALAFSSLKHEADRRVDAAFESNGPPVVVEREPEGEAGGELVRGGGSLSTCTAGFPVFDKDTKVRGIITADHCQRSQNYEGRAVLTYRRSMAGRHGDIAFYEASETVQPSFWHTQQSYRFIKGNRSPYLDQPVCFYGKTTNLSCDYVRDFGECRGIYCNLVSTYAHKTQPGDSGGPWFDHAHAVGVHSGYECSAIACWSEFSYTRGNVGSNLGVNILIDQ